MVCVVALPPEQHGDVGGVGSNLCHDGTDGEAWRPCKGEAHSLSAPPAGSTTVPMASGHGDEDGGEGVRMFLCL